MPDELEEILNQLNEPVESTIPAVEPIVLMNSELSEPIQPETQDPIILEEFVKRYEDGVLEIVSSVRSDRTEAQKAIDFCDTELTKMVNGGKPPNATLVEAWVQAIQVKANINTNYIKILDGGAKLISAGKAKVSITNNNTNTGDIAELNAMLNTPLKDSDI
jgi:hypothetical protein